MNAMRILLLLLTAADLAARAGGIMPFFPPNALRMPAPALLNHALPLARPAFAHDEVFNRRFEMPWHRRGDLLVRLIYKEAEGQTLGDDHGYLLVQPGRPSRLVPEDVPIVLRKPFPVYHFGSLVPIEIELKNVGPSTRPYLRVQARQESYEASGTAGRGLEGISKTLRVIDLKPGEKAVLSSDMRLASSPPPGAAAINFEQTHVLVVEDEGAGSAIVLDVPQAGLIDPPAPAFLRAASRTKDPAGLGPKALGRGLRHGYNQPMRRFLTVIACLSLMAAAGCDEKDGASPASLGSLISASDSGTSGPSAATSGSTGLEERAPAAAQAARMAGPKGELPPDEEALASKYAGAFDGSRSAGGLKGVPDAGSPVAGSLGGWGRVRPAKINGQPRKVNLDKSGVPAPGTLPKVDLPGPESGADVSAGARGGGPVLLAFEAFEKKFYDSVAPVFSRSAWRAHAAANGGVHQNPSRVTVHHTDGKQTFDEQETLAAVRNIQAFHMGSDPKHGWDDIGYHFLIDGAGRVVEGRHTDIMGAHAHNYNENNVGIALLGDYNRDKPTAAQVDSLRRLVTFLALKYRTDPSQKGFLEPHRHYNDTDCPGKNVVAILEQLGRDIDGDTTTLVARYGSGGSAAENFTPMFVAQR